MVASDACLEQFLAACIIRIFSRNIYGMSLIMTNYGCYSIIYGAHDSTHIEERRRK